jgi:hypothetical protein
MAQTPDYSKSYGSGVANALMIAQTRKTNAEATLVEDQKNRARLESDFYGSVAGLFSTISTSSGSGKSTDKLKPSTKEEKIMKIGKGRKMNQAEAAAATY